MTHEQRDDWPDRDEAEKPMWFIIPATGLMLIVLGLVVLMSLPVFAARWVYHRCGGKRFKDTH